MKNDGMTIGNHGACNSTPIGLLEQPMRGLHRYFSNDYERVNVYSGQQSPLALVGSASAKRRKSGEPVASAAQVSPAQAAVIGVPAWTSP
ncbi:predicted protein [Plenodomus lingam JN3]|uniref:Predicted protein n=1 Tax=Leptosphaeria maculans (strain JN3 / isolate v23.1.3 / race Av1-4-5-6-7-8) TaxID=985895 RepID=E5A3P8_LEPMJ|nr:predicted protein [Plenodomus lingam JN3]CBX98261.1 predicted protein [Plenodomus lingam JN3]